MSGRIKCFLTFGLIFFSSLCFTWGQVFENYDDKIVIEEENGWYSYPSLARIDLDFDEFPLVDIAITIPGNASVFVDNKMWFFAVKDTSFTVSSGSLRERFPSKESIRQIAVYKEGIQKEN